MKYYEQMPPNDNNFPVKFLVQYLYDTVNLHWHEHIELLYFTKGTGVVCCGMKKIKVKKGNLAIINSNEFHSIHTEGKLEYYCAIISPRMFIDINENSCIFQNFIMSDEYITKCFEQLYSEFTNKEEGYDMAVKGIVYSLFACLVRKYKENDISQKEFNRRTINTERVNNVIMYINSHYAEKMTLSFLASSNHISKHYLCHFFKEITGFTVLDYINHIRIEKSKILLKNTGLGIGEVANAVGYDDVNYFCRIFKKHISVSPGQYKKLKIFNL